MSGDFPGEAQYYYEKYCADGEEFDIKGGFENSKLYVKDGVALYVTGMGKVNAALSLNAILNDDILWNPDYGKSVALQESEETSDIFATAMENNFLVGNVVIDAVLNSKLYQ